MIGLPPHSYLEVPHYPSNPHLFSFLLLLLFFSFFFSENVTARAAGGEAQRDIRHDTTLRSRIVLIPRREISCAAGKGEGRNAGSQEMGHNYIDTGTRRVVALRATR